MRSSKANSLDAVDFSHSAQQPRKIPACRRWIAIAVHILPQQLDLAISHTRQLGGFVQNALAGAAALRPASEGNHAISAGFVAAFNDRDVSSMWIVAAGVGRL